MADRVALSVPGRVTFDVAPAILADLAGQAGSRAFTLDLGGCADFDSSLIGVLLDLLRRAGPAAGDCRFDGPDHNLRKLARLYGIDELLFERGPLAGGAGAE